MTPLLRWGNALLKLELFRPRGSAADRVPAPSGVVELSGNQALSFARPGATFALRGVQASVRSFDKSLERIVLPVFRDSNRDGHGSESFAS